MKLSMDDIVWVVCGPEYFSVQDIFYTRGAARERLRYIKNGHDTYRYPEEIPDHIERCRIRTEKK